MSDPLPADRADTRFGFVETLRVLWASRTFRCCALLVAFGSVPGYGMMVWGATFLMRVHGLSPAETGFIFGTVSMTALVVGQLFAGIVADWAGRRDIRAYLWCAAAGCGIALPFGLLFVGADSLWLAMIGFALQSFFLGSHSMCAYTISQSVVPPRTRGTASMIISLGATILGFGVAPLIIGISNDWLEPLHGVFSIRYSLVIVLSFLVLSVISSLVGTIWVRSEYDALHQAPVDSEGEQS
jgi:MFS family permease